MTFLALAFILSIIPFKIPMIGSQTMLAASFYVAGASYSKCALGKKSSLLAGLLGMALVVVIATLYQGSMFTKAADIFLYFLIALLGSYAMLNLAGCIMGHAQRVLDYIGSRTLYILTFHFISLKLVSLLKLWHYDLPIEHLSEFPVIAEQNSYYWILYALVGVIVPLLIWELADAIKHQCSKPFHAAEHANIQA